ncbi:MFS transporter [Rhodococcoides kyotonense]|uniref:MFS transporter, MHS family, alpha-ketoglutarate permease n=1 Tax=Rhodococcoides kyotonense TaxID=398843 RepID=A0A239HMS9_9NOCA|nr:MFS transporter [Rhodococcus kyotonensis]SNS82650.1 MFS transporter, MHS family, alpha-ketoglutarate permease [Rhodococcus kyotonensis]
MKPTVPAPLQTIPGSAITTQTADELPRKRRSLIGVSLGNALEGYDWAVYAVFAPFFATQVFDPADPTSALLSTFVVFGAGFLVRPFGGVLFGWWADKFGRKSSLMAAIGCATVGMALIAAVPTYDTAGFGAGAVLLLARLLQGLAHTGEVASAYTYVAEVAPPRRRGLWSSAIYVSFTAAIIAATLIGALLNTALAPETMSAWGWRVPFALGFVLGVTTLVMRRRMPESHAFTELVDEHPTARRSLAAGLWTYRSSGIRVFLVMASLSALYYAWGVASTTTAIKISGIDATQALWAGVGALTVSVFAYPAAGALSDRIGRRGSFFLFGVGVAVMAYPMDHLARQGAWGFAIAMTVMLSLFALVGSILPALFSELFPTEVRATGIALPYALSAVVFAGPTPYLQQWLAGNGYGYVFPGYLAGAAILGAVVMYFTPETAGHDFAKTAR